MHNKTLLNKATTLNKAIDLATTWQNKANTILTNFEKGFHVKMEKMLNHPEDKVFLINLMDQSFRSHNVSRVKNQIEYLFTKYRMASFFTSSERFLIFLFRYVGVYMPQISIPLFIDNIRHDMRTVVIPGEYKALNKHLLYRKRENIRVNVNLIGETVLGESESRERMDKYLTALKNPNIDYLSVKISTIFSQINPLSHEKTVETLAHRLIELYRQAKKYTCTNLKGESEYKFVNLDMEEYRDLSLTVRSFQKALESPDLKDFKAGIVLQAYLPDSHLWQKELTKWAKKRVRNGGSPIKMRLVKGANMEMEETEASLKNWAAVPYRKKIDTDSNYKIMAEYALRPENICAVNLGAASHNLFELAYCYELAEKNNVMEHFSLEMLEGMSEASRKAIYEISGKNVILYAPIAEKELFTNAVAYLVRRLDENTNEDHFIRHSFGLTTQSPQWEMLKKQFVDSFENKNQIFIGSHRQQNRLEERWEDDTTSSFKLGRFNNEPDTDFILPANQKWACGIRTKWMKKKGDPIETVPLVFAGQEVSGERDIVDCIDKSQIKDGIICGRYTKAQPEDLLKAAEVAVKDPDGWRNLSPSERQKILCQVANKVRTKRGDLIGVAAAEVGKIFTETDVEVSEAVDFLEFYGHSIRYFEKIENIKFKGKGVGLVVPPWNFPIAIPLGGVAAALAAGNTVILKPASNAVLCSYEMCKCFWEAGVSKNTLQLLPCPGSVAGEHLVKNKNINFVILTGGEDTAISMLNSRPNLLLTAETGGKNATIVTAMADREQAIKNVVSSAFGNSGQKCSATSLLILENEVYYDEKLREALIDASQSMKVGSVWDFECRIGTLANVVSGDLKRAIESLEDGESWALKPEFVDNNKYMLKPAIRWGVKDDSFCHKTELFGPVLSVLRADNLKHAIELVNKTGYGLTSGIESLDEREINEWRQSIKAGNLYINRGTTGAIVLRQPFGGIGKSAIGSGRKVGVYNYITQFMDIEDVAPPRVTNKVTRNVTTRPPVTASPLDERRGEVPTRSFFDLPRPEAYFSYVEGKRRGRQQSLSPRGEQLPRNEENLYLNLLEEWGEKYKIFTKDLSQVKQAVESYIYHYEHEFSKEHDYFKLRGEDNIFRYMKLKVVALRVSENDSLFECLSRILAAKISGATIQISVTNEMNNSVSEFLFHEACKLLQPTDTMKKESEVEFAKSFPSVDRIIYSKESEVSDFIFSEAARLTKFIVRTPPLMEGRLECLHYFNEQSISHSYHRYGNLGERAYSNPHFS